MSVMNDPDLAALGTDQKLELVKARLQHASMQLAEALLNRKAMSETDGTGMDQTIASWRKSVQVHRAEFNALIPKETPTHGDHH